MELDFTLDGVSAKSKGVILQKPIELSPLVPSITTVKIAGRSGNVHIFNDAYESRTATATCYCLGDDVTTAMANVSEFLLGTFGERKLGITSGFHYKAVITSAAELQTRLNLLNPFTIVFDCSPFRFADTVQSVQTTQTTRRALRQTSQTPKNSSTLTNPTPFVAYPRISVNIRGAGTLVVNGETFEIRSPKQPVIATVDSDRLDVSGVSGGLNNLVNWTRFPMLSPGENTISWSGDIDVLSIEPNWRYL